MFAKLYHAPGPALCSRDSKLDAIPALKLLPGWWGRWASTQNCSPIQRGSDGAVHQVPHWQTPFCLEGSEKETPRWVLKGEEMFFRLVSEGERVLAKGIVHARVPNIACLVKAMWLLSMGKEF